MSFVVDQVRRIDGQLDRLQLSVIPSIAEPLQTSTSDGNGHHIGVGSRISQLHAFIKALSTTSTPKIPLAHPRIIHSILHQARLSETCNTCETSSHDRGKIDIESTGGASYEHELEWLLLSKATVQTYGQVLNTILEQTIPLSDDIWYWDDVLGSYRYAGLYSIQTSPWRFWSWSQGVYKDVRERGGALAQGWDHFYKLVKEVVRERSLSDVRRQVVSPLSRVTNEARKKQSTLKKIRQVNANALGLLLGEGLIPDTAEDDGTSTPSDEASALESSQKWKNTVAKSIALMEAVLQNALILDVAVDTFDEAIATSTNNDPFYSVQDLDGEASASALKPSAVSERLQAILETHLPEYTLSLQNLVAEHGRPSRIVRYWLPVAALVISSSTLLRIAMNRKEEVLIWIREFGNTVLDFWANWVVEPTKKVIGTIRHDEGSEVSIMSKKSLEGDRASLERMVVDFAVTNPENGTVTESELADVRAKVREGDLTPVLKAYEKDLAKPFMGAVRGNLIRALLIQIQKTKVDVEVAMSGIDSILRSQELLFGFIGLTPGVLVCIGVSRWIKGLFSTRKGLKSGRRKGELIRVLRNIDRILTAATPTDFGELYYKDHGLLLCEVHVLRQHASKVMPRQIFHDFLEELEDLVDVKAGVKRQQRVIERLHWAYSKWMS
ncbi:NCA2-domain-containing protein [Patellaria atrata CBS 101060]|uniref:NCA2-domain-containing protein n=1 Tax=Patellaria atrata CBS 101060 TaxID=1346257 RepID=A0A9P4SHQ3_9PEZI|nr:NCA2-domain-containing protein [Patellaria atrata CBS 101060]